jgi:hypothetical protein
MLTRLNVEGDPNLEAMRAEVAESIASQDPDSLREDETMRSDVATVAEDIFNRMAAFYSPQE